MKRLLAEALGVGAYDPTWRDLAALAGARLMIHLCDVLLQALPVLVFLLAWEIVSGVQSCLGAK